ncbi:transporter substrate-binding domain-containing protein [Streptomyces sp. NPDC051041]|uniref:transporter substrate-binding domain-containing protein n=1 Tax=Streptomyces sp. NPDC051041 TaxID=3365640 RepID=UPI0037A6E72D
MTTWLAGGRARKTRTRWAAALAVAGLLAVCACSDPEPTFLGKERITIAHKNDQPGTSYKPDYNYSGFDYLLGNRIADELGIKANRLDVPSDERVTALTEGDVDLVIATFSITDERMELVDFVGPYAVTYQGFMVAEDSDDIRTVEDLRGRSVCTWGGTTSAEVLDSPAYEDIEDYEAGDASDCLEDIRRGRADAVSTDQMILYGFAEQYAGEGLRVLSGVTIGPPQYYGIGMSKGHRADCERLREIVKRYVGSSDWLADLRQSLSLIPEKERNWQTQYRPSDTDIDARSCQDRTSP